KCVLAAHIADVIMAIPPREFLLQCSIIRCAPRVCTEIIPKRKLVANFNVANRTRMSMMRPHPVLVLAEVEAPRCTWNLRIQALTADAIAKSLHRAAEAPNGRRFAQHHEEIDDGLGRQSGDRRAANMMDSNQGLAEHAL